MSGIKEAHLILFPFEISSVLLDPFKGAVRLTQEFYNNLQQQINDGLKKKIEEMEKAFDKVLEFNTNKEGKNVELVFPSYEKKLLQETNEIDLLIEHLEGWKESRKKIEEQKELRKDLSEQIQKQIDELIEKKNELEERQKKYSMADDNKVNEIKEKAKSLMDKCSLLSDIYPDWAEKTISILNQRKLNSRILRTIEREINNKLDYINDPSKKEKLLKLSCLRKKFEAIPFLFRLSHDKKEEFYKKLTDIIQNIESGFFNNQEIQELEGDIEKLRKGAIEADKKARFEEAKDKAIKALYNRGYSLVKEKDVGYYLELEGTKTDGKKAKIKVLKPDAEDNMSPMIIEIDQNGYNDSKEWENEGKELAWELESLGLIVDFEEISTHFKGKLLQNAARSLKKKMEQKAGISPLEVKIEGEDRITIVYKNGSQKQIEWREYMSLNDVISNLQETPSEDRVQRGALLEEEL